ncbi:tensin-2-like isoform X3 [Dunckerocampus dactyliophorus]|uniref:tensin-2-like isoform X3 n=1 Tax=Dunckerocampus dactyliophorus TaxID=161453 RepID=UPI002406B0E8|nr:tensin-2-like isoform X3 [Dunckerocampus dactyliophorus]
MGCIHSLTTRRIKNHETDTGGIALVTDTEVLPEILQLAEQSKAASHAFTERSFKRRRMCDVCQQTIDTSAAFCRDCKVAVHKTCEAKVSPTCASTPNQHNSIKSASLRKRGSMPRSQSEEQGMEHVMERHYDFDLTYITERIISVFFMPELEEQRYRRDLQEMVSMLKSKHQDKFLLLNLSEKRHDITRLNPKVQDFGWPDLHAPPLDGICTVCKAMETWMSADPNNVVVLHCKGNKGKTGVIVAAYMHYSKISAGVDQALTTLAMRKFCEDKVSFSLQPSQNRYIYYFGGLLSGSIKMNSSPLFLHQILIPSLPNFQTGGGYFPFVKIYQSLQLIYTSCVYNPQSSRSRKLCVTMEPALLLKGDIMVKCYHRRSQAAEREVVFRIQFHTCTIHGAQLWFGKKELDVACSDDRFPRDAAVEFIFSSGPEKIKEHQKTDASVKVNYNTSDPVVRWDSYENFNLHHEDSIENISHTRGPLDGSLYAQVRKRRGPDQTSSSDGCLTSSPTVKSQPLTRTSSCAPCDHKENHSTSTAHPERENTECPIARGGENETRQKLRGKEKDGETEILEDGDPSSLGGLRREHSCCGRAGAKCGGGMGQQWEREPSLSNGHCSGCCNNMKKHPKSQTLPAVPSKSISPSPHLTHMDLCQRHSVHPLPELPWERTPPSLSWPHRPCFPYSPPEHAHPHSHTLPASNRHYTDEECQVFHYSSHAPTSHVSHQSLPSSPYREMFFGSPTPSPGCPCRECSSRREHQSSSVRAFHPMHPEQAVELQRTREALWESKNPWEMPREADFWQCKSAIPPFHICHSAMLDQGTNPEQLRFVLGPHRSFPSPQSLMDMRDGASSGYHTPLLPRHSCPCSPYQSSPVESHESRGYASGYLSGSASPLPASSPSPGRGRLQETPPLSREQQHPDVKAGTAKPSAAIDICQGSKGKPDRSSTQTLDSDHDYTVISGGSPTHTEDSVNAVITQSEEAKTEIQSSNITQPSSELSQSSPSNGKLDEAKVKGNEEATNQSQSTTIIITPVEDQLNGSDPPGEGPSANSKGVSVNLSASINPSPSNTSQNSPIESLNHNSSPKHSPSATDPPGNRLTPERDSSTDTKPPSPTPDGYHTPTFPIASYYYPMLSVPHVPYTGYTAVTIPAIQPPLPEKKRISPTPGPLNGHTSLLQGSPISSPTHSVTLSPSMGELRKGSTQFSSREDMDIRVNAKFVQDSSKYWYKPSISRDQAIAVLKDKEPGTFLIRDSNSFQGAYGLALKVATPPLNANTTAEVQEQLVRHFLIETGPRGVKIKGCQNESYFGSLSALVYQHSITPISLPCALRIPERGCHVLDLVGELQGTRTVTNTSTAADLLKQGAACSVLYLNSVETESLTGPEAVSKATKCTLALTPRPSATVVHFKVSSQGITLTDSKRRLFFRRHYPISSVTFSSLDPQDQRWTNCDSTSSKMFGFVARRTGSSTANVCHLFAEMDPEQPAVAIVNFINKVMLGPQLRR